MLAATKDYFIRVYSALKADSLVNLSLLHF